MDCIQFDELSFHASFEANKILGLHDMEHSIIKLTCLFRCASVIENCRFNLSFDTGENVWNVWRHSLPRRLVMTLQWWHDGRISLECWECKKYLTCYIIMTSTVYEKRSILTYFQIFSSTDFYFTGNHWLLWKHINFKSQATV